MNKVLSIIKNNKSGSNILNDVYESAHKLYCLNSFDYFDSYYRSFNSSCKKLLGYYSCLLDLKIVSVSDSFDFIEILFRYQDIVENISKSHFKEVIL